MLYSVLSLRWLTAIFLNIGIGKAETHMFCSAAQGRWTKRGPSSKRWTNRGNLSNIFHWNNNFIVQVKPFVCITYMHWSELCK